MHFPQNGPNWNKTFLFLITEVELFHFSFLARKLEKICCSLDQIDFFSLFNLVVELKNQLFTQPYSQHMSGSWNCCFYSTASAQQFEQMNAGVTGCPVALPDSSSLTYWNPTRVAGRDPQVFHFLDVMPRLCLCSQSGWQYKTGSSFWSWWLLLLVF